MHQITILSSSSTTISAAPPASPAVQGHGHGATLRPSSSSPASPGPQRPTVSFVKRFLPVSVELLTLLELFGGRRAGPTWSEPPPAPFVALARFLAPQRSLRPDRPPPEILPHCACFVFLQNGKRCWPMDWCAATRQLWPVPASIAILSSTASCLLISDATFPALDGCVLAVSDERC